MKKGKYITCPMCSRQFYIMPYEFAIRKYCSRRCLGKANGNRLKGKPAPWNGDRKRKKICIVCGNEFMIFPSRFRRQGDKGMTCGRQCADRWHSTRMRKPLDTTDIFMRCLEICSGCSIKEYPGYYFKQRPQIYRRDQNTCQLCGAGGSVCHHIDYDRRNNDPENLIILCNKCHGKTNHHRDYWQDALRDHPIGVTNELSN